jgi:uncharacterized membrane protein
VDCLYVTGVLEFLGAVGLLVAKLRSVAGICLIVLLVAMFPANVRAARERLPLRGKPRRCGCVYRCKYSSDLVGEPVESARADTIGGLQVSLGLKPVS